MSGGPILPSSVYLGGASGNLFPNFYAGGGGNAAAHDEGIGVVGSLGADSVAELRFECPPTIPSGTAKIRVLSLCATNSLNGKFNIADGNVAAGASPSAATLTASATQTITWGASSADKYVETKVAISSTPNGNDVLVVALKFLTASWTQTGVSTHLVSLIWE
jgi:hypothetical protein